MNAQEHIAQDDGDQLRIMVESVRDYAIFLLSPTGTITTWNAGAERIKGYKAEEIIGQNFSVFYIPEDCQEGKPAKALETATRLGHHEEDGWRVAKDGSKFWASVVITAIRDQTGALTGFGKVVRDLTEMKRVEDELRASRDELERRVRERTAVLLKLNESLKASEERFRLMIEGVKDYAIYMLDTEGRVTSWNEGARHIYGYSAQDIIGSPRSQFFAPEDIASGLQTRELKEAAATGRFSEEAWRVRKDRSRFWANGTLSALRNNSGDLTGFVNVVRDLTERKQIEGELRRNIDALQLRDRAIRAVSLGILIADANAPGMPIVYASPGFERLTGYSTVETVGRNCRFLQGPKTDAQTAREIRSRVHAGQGCEVEILNYRKDGSSFWNALSITPVHDERGHLTHFVGVQTDITERKDLEEQVLQLQKMHNG